MRFRCCCRAAYIRLPRYAADIATPCRYALFSLRRCLPLTRHACRYWRCCRAISLRVFRFCHDVFRFAVCPRCCIIFSCFTLRHTLRLLRQKMLLAYVTSYTPFDVTLDDDYISLRHIR